MKAAMQGQATCVHAIMMSGTVPETHVHACQDRGRKLSEWALFTGRYETARLLLHLTMRPYAEQFSLSFRMERPTLHRADRRTADPASRCQEAVTLSVGAEPRKRGALDYMVRMTTALASPLLATACWPVCPGSPPCVGRLGPAGPQQSQHKTPKIFSSSLPQWAGL
uniref:Uncharacterized protein n=1 Tax=Electrophorus electricus TaxID=8005 RepID=A0AAY5EF42_ELEEL